MNDEEEREAELFAMMLECQDEVDSELRDTVLGYFLDDMRENIEKRLLLRAK